MIDFMRDRLLGEQTIAPADLNRIFVTGLPGAGGRIHHRSGNAAVRIEIRTKAEAQLAAR